MFFLVTWQNYDMDSEGVSGEMFIYVGTNILNAQFGIIPHELRNEWEIDRNCI